MSRLINSEWTESTFTFLASVIRKLVQVCEYFQDYDFYSYWHIGKRYVCEIWYTLHVYSYNERKEHVKYK